MSILNKIKNLAGSAVDAVVPGNQAYLHGGQAPQRPMIDPISPQTQQAMQQLQHLRPIAPIASMAPRGMMNAQGQEQWNPIMGGAPIQSPLHPHTTQGMINVATGHGNPMSNPVLEDWFRRSNIDY